jgi:uncharacterized protein YdeI (YjbR/CyaY-like superfamily)
VYAKKHTGIPSLTYNDAVEEALCFGWIDSLIHPIDDAFFKQVFTPRKRSSAWSAVNRKRVERLIEAGLMTAAGLALVTLAKKTGRWQAHAAAESLTLPPELKEALDANPAAKKNWPTYTDSQRKMFLYSIHGAKRPETRAARVARVIDIVSRRVSFSELTAAAMSGGTAKRGKKATGL